MKRYEYGLIFGFVLGFIGLFTCWVVELISTNKTFDYFLSRLIPTLILTFMIAGMCGLFGMMLGRFYDD